VNDQSKPAPVAAVSTDLLPLAWVLTELRKSLEMVTKALKRHARELASPDDPNVEAADTTQLRLAQTHLHQSAGALQMVGLSAPVQVLSAMEAVVERFFDNPALCQPEAIANLSGAGLALTEYLSSLLAAKAVSAVSLFPQYQAVQRLAGADRIHPADLWQHDWQWKPIALSAAVAPLAYSDDSRGLLEQSVLKLLKGSPSAAHPLRDVCLGFSAAQSPLQARSFWVFCAAFFEALDQGLLPLDIYVKRAASRILLQQATLARGEAVSVSLAHDLLFFCAQAMPLNVEQVPILYAVRVAYGLEHAQAVNYERASFGRFDPLLLAQARKRIVSARDCWSNLNGRDLDQLAAAQDPFSLLVESLKKLHPPSAQLAQTMLHAVSSLHQHQQAPSTELAMEIATDILYLEAVFEEVEMGDSAWNARMERMVERLQHVLQGGASQPLEPWMEELYRHVNERQTMGSVVGELQISLGQLEKNLDQFFRDPGNKEALIEVPGLLSQMRGVFSVLGLDQAAQTVVHMRSSVENMLDTEINPEQARMAGSFDKLGNNVGTLGFLIDMLNYQPMLAKKFFVYDEAQAELRPLTGRSQAPLSETPPSADLLLQEPVLAMEPAIEHTEPVSLVDALDHLAQQAELADQPALAQTALAAAEALDAGDTMAASLALNDLTVRPAPVPPPAQADDAFDEADLLHIFLDEGRELVLAGQWSLTELSVNPADIEQQTDLRRAFHSLKGSSRMLGLNEFGEASWALEQLLNADLAEQKPLREATRTLAQQALSAFALWLEDIASGTTQNWSADPFRISADALRLEGRLVPIDLLSPVQKPAPAQESASQPDDSWTVQLELDAQALPATEWSLPVAADHRARTAATEPPLVEIADIDWPSLKALTQLEDHSAPPQEPALVPQAPTLTPEVLAFAPEVPTFVPEVVAVTPEVPPFIAEVASPSPELPPFITEIPPFIADAPAPVPEPAPDSTPAELLLESSPAPFIHLAEVADRQPLAREAEPALPPAEAEAEAVKLIGDLRVDIALYTVYLSEADEWSRRLVTDLSEWSMELDQAMPESVAHLAHSLIGSSATVGFTALAELARLLEQALQHMQHAQIMGTASVVATLIQGAEEVRRLLHQFAAGFLKTPAPAVVDALKQLWLDLSTPSSDVDKPFQAPIPDEMENELALEPVALRAPLVFEDDDDIDQQDAVDPDLLSVFEEDANDLLTQLSGALRQWLARPDNRNARVEVLRALHTLKGSARLAGAMRIGEMAHRTESAIANIQAQNSHAALIEPLLGRLDVMQAAFDALRQQAAAPSQTESNLHPPEPPQQAPAQALQPLQPPQATQARAVGPAATGGSPGTPITPVARPTLTPLVRVRSDLLDRMVNQASEVLLSRTRLEADVAQLRSALGDLTDNLDRLRQQLREIELQAESQMQSRLAQTKETSAGFDPLEFDRFTRVQELTRMMAESVNDVATVQCGLQRTVESSEDALAAQARQTRDLQRELMRTRMAEFESIAERLYRVVRQAAKDTGKQVKLDIVGGSTEMDRGVMERMLPSFEHLLRNCVVHGIETPEQRAVLGKQAGGQITIALHQAGNDVSIDFSDDGAGLNVNAIEQRARALGLLDGSHAMTVEEASQLIFTPGFSTVDEVTELAGRGIGMDVVRSEVNALGGRILTESTPAVGTRFELTLPLTTAVTQVVLLRAGADQIGVPTPLIETVLRVQSSELRAAYTSGLFERNGSAIPFHWLGALLQTSTASTDEPSKTLSVVVLRSANQRLAMHVDQVLGNLEVVVRNLGPQLSRLPGLNGITTLASGRVLAIYNPVALAAVYGDRVARYMAQSASPAVPGQSEADTRQAHRSPLVLVVDDSITVRRVTQRLLLREGYRVALARDGLQALEQLQQERPAVVLSDIEMPRMDGFDLVRNIRSIQQLADLPIVMITSRIAESTKQQAELLGVEHYLGKPYSEEQLLAVLKTYCRAEVAA